MADELTSEFVLGTLCSNATDLEVRDCLRKYDITHTLGIQKRVLNKFTKEVLVKTAKYLELSTDGLLKPAVVHSIIVRIQNLLPDTCQICHERYKFSIGEKPFLACKMCGQEVHKQCFQVLLGIENCDDVNINPHNLPGIHYLCQACEDKIIPKNNPEDTIDLPSTQAFEQSLFAQPSEKVSKPNSADSQQQYELESSELQQAQLPCINSSVLQFSTSELNSTSLDSTNQPLSGNNSQKQSQKKICAHYRRNQCRFGMKGKDCPFLHPERCKKLLAHGTKQPDGCNLGKKCEHFHPKMCPNSIAKRLCLDDKCQLTHVKGTARKKEPKKHNQTQEKVIKTQEKVIEEKSSNSGLKNKSNVSPDDNALNSSSFLAMVSLLRKELCEAMDTKIALAISQLNPFNRVQQSYPTQYQIPMQSYPPQFPQVNPTMSR